MSGSTMPPPNTPSPWYRLVDDVPVQLTWGEYLAFSAPLSTPEERRVGTTFLAHPDGRTARVSTIYMGLDCGPAVHNDPPVLWETMIFRPDEDDDSYQERYTSAQDAMDGHRRAVAGLIDVGYDETTEVAA